jgi:preprotein translocase subunit SecA
VLFVSVEDDLVVRHANDALPPLDPDESGRLRDKAVDRAVEHAQRVAEGISFALHRNTWRYSVVTEQQRQVLAERRQDLLTTDAAARLLAERSPQRYEEVRDSIGEPALIRAARSIALLHLDRCWADHLAELAEVREGVHLRALGRLDPLDEYHRAAVPAFKVLLSEVDDRTVATFEAAEITGDSWDPADAGLPRPTATWTYMVHDNPFGSEMERFFTAIARAAVNRR